MVFQFQDDADLVILVTNSRVLMMNGWRFSFFLVLIECFQLLSRFRAQRKICNWLIGKTALTSLSFLFIFVSLFPLFSDRFFLFGSFLFYLFLSLLVCFSITYNSILLIFFCGWFSVPFYIVYLAHFVCLCFCLFSPFHIRPWRYVLCICSVTVSSQKNKR